MTMPTRILRDPLLDRDDKGGDPRLMCLYEARHVEDDLRSPVGEAIMNYLRERAYKAMGELIEADAEDASAIRRLQNEVRLYYLARDSIMGLLSRADVCK